MQVSVLRQDSSDTVPWPGLCLHNPRHNSAQPTPGCMSRARGQTCYVSNIAPVMITMNQLQLRSVNGPLLTCPTEKLHKTDVENGSCRPSVGINTSVCRSWMSARKLYNTCEWVKGVWPVTSVSCWLIMLQCQYDTYIYDRPQKIGY